MASANGFTVSSRPDEDTSVSGINPVLSAYAKTRDLSKPGRLTAPDSGLLVGRVIHLGFTSELRGIRKILIYRFGFTENGGERSFTFLNEKRNFDDLLVT